MTDHAVIIAGGGPTGLTLAAELALAGIDVAIVERRTSQVLAGSRAGGLHARTIEGLDQRGVADRFLSRGKTHPVVYFHVMLDISDFPTRHPYVLGLFQNHIERTLAEWVEQLGVPIHRGREVVGFTQDDAGVHIDVSDGTSLHAEYLVGCDGGRSIVRKAAGIDFPGSDPTTSWMLAEVLTVEEPAWGFREDAAGKHAIGKADGGRVGIVLAGRDVQASGEPTMRELSEALIEIYGTDFGVHSPAWLTRFTDVTRQAATYRKGRVLLAGDAAHVHPPMGGQGLNVGVQDAMNLGWKLAQVIDGTSPDDLLDSYHAERHAVGARVQRNALAQTALRRPDDRSQALGAYVAEFLGADVPRKRMVGEISGLDIHYDLGEGHPLLGRRMPDLDVITGDGPTRVFTLLHDARPVLLDFSESVVLESVPRSIRVRLVDATYAGAWELPVIGAVAAPSAVLIRPDGYVAWVGNGSATGLGEAMTTWFGSPAR